MAHTLESLQRAGYTVLSSREPAEWRERVIQRAFTHQESIYHAVTSIAIEDGRVNDYSQCACTPCSRSAGRLSA
jgi:hypothetical protein